MGISGAALRACIWVIVVASVWAAFTGWHGENISPGPGRVGLKVYELLGSTESWYSISATMFRVIAGCFLTLVVSCALALFVEFGLGRKLGMEALTTAFLAVPAIVWAMFSVAIDGPTNFAAVLAIMGVAVPFVAVGLFGAFAELDKDFLDVARVFGVPKSRAIRWYILPNILNSLFAAARTSLALSWKVVVIAETFGFQIGVGKIITDAFAVYDVGRILAITVIFMCLILVIDRLALFAFRGRLQ